MLLEINYGLYISLQERSPYKRIEFHRPIKRFTAPSNRSQVVNNIPAPQDEYSLLSQHPQFSTHIKHVLSRKILIDTQLDNWYIRLRIHIREHRPCTMIQSPVIAHANRRCLHCLQYPPRKLRTARSAVREIIEMLGKAVEIMDRLRLFI